MDASSSSDSRLLTRSGLAAGTVVTGLVYLSGLATSDAQQALFSAVEGDRNLAARSAQARGDVDAPIQLGPVSITAAAYLNLTYTDNSLNSPTKESDYILEPGVNFGLFYPVTDTTRLTFGFGVGYQFYLEGTRPDQLVLTPNSELAYDFRVGDAQITVFDRFSFSSDLLDNGQFVNSGNYGGIDNTAGLRTIYAPEPLYVEGGYSHFNFWANDDQYEDLTRASEQFFLRAGRIVAERTRWGLEGSFGYTHYQLDLRNNLYQTTVGPYVEWQINDAWSLSGRVGWSWTDFEQSGLLPAPETVSLPYLGLDVTHQLTQNFSHSWSMTREVDVGIQTQYTQSFVFNYGFRWRLTDLLSFNAGAYYEIGEEPTAVFTEDYTYWGFSAGIPFAITENFGLNLGYLYRQRDSNIPSRAYDRNNVTIGATYTF